MANRLPASKTNSQANGHGNGAAANGALSTQQMAGLRARLGRMDEVVLKEMNSLLVGSLTDFRGKWLFDNKNARDVMKQCRRMADTEPNDYVQFVIATKLYFFNAGFELWSPKNREKTQVFLDASANYPFTNLARDVWTEYMITSNVVAFWMGRAQANPEQLVDGIPIVTVFNSESVEYHNDFGIESVKFTPKQRKLTAEEKRKLHPVHAEAIENGKQIELSTERGEHFKVLTTAKLGNGFAMPRWKAVFDDLAIRDLFRVGDFNGAWARKHVIRHGKKGHKITDGQLAGMPEFFAQPKFMKALLKSLQGAGGFMELVSNFDLLFEYVYLKPEFFSPEIHKGVEDRLAKWAGAAVLMLREGNPNPNLAKMFQAEGLAEREIVGKFLEAILNDASFLPTRNTRGIERLKVRWDEFIFLNQDELRQMIAFGLQNGIMSPQTAQKLSCLDTEEEQALMEYAHSNRKKFTPTFESKQGNSKDNNGGDAGVTGGRPPAKTE